MQFCGPVFTWMHSFKVVIGAEVTTEAETDPGPSLVKLNVRAVPPESAAESSIRSRKMIVASDAVPLDSGAGVVMEVAVADGPGEAETSGEADEPPGVAVGPDAPEA